MIRNAGLFNCSLNGMPMAWFSERTEDREVTSTNVFQTLQEAEREIHIFKYREIYEELAKK